MLHLLMAAALAAHAPDGTYTYDVAGAGTSTVVIASKPGRVEVAERFFGAGLDETTASVFDAETLQETGYSADAVVAGAKQHARAAFSQGTVTLHAGTQTIAMHADASAPDTYYFDSLLSLVVMLPAIEERTRAQRLTIATNRGTAMIAVVSEGNASPRPEGIGKGARALGVAFGSVLTTLWYDPATLVLQAFTQPGAVVRLQSSSPQTSPPSAPVESTPLPLPPARYASRDVAFLSKDGTRLAGTITTPQNKRTRLPAVLMLHGSGPEDRDETIGPNKIFLQIANALSNAGFVVFRYDKRGIGRSGGIASDRSAAILDDARAALAFLRLQPGVDLQRVYLLGHSEGAMAAPLISGTDVHLAGLILIGAPALPLDRIVLKQLTRGLSGAELARRRSAVRESLRSGADAFSQFVRSWNVDPAWAIARIHAPALILQGGKDIQILPEDMPRLLDAARRAHRDVSARVFPDDDHLMIVVPGSEPSTGAEYFRPAYVDRAAIAAVLAWLRAH